MDKFGFCKVRSFVPEVKLADISTNIDNIIKVVKEAEADHVEILVFPELSITGYTCADLFLQDLLLEGAEKGVRRLCEETSDTEVLFAVGAPVVAFDKIFNCALLICKGKLLGIVPKIHIPNYSEFYEKRWFESGKGIRETDIEFAGFKVPFGTDILFLHRNVKVGVEICEDLWVPQPPSGRMALAGAEVILNLSASDELIGKHDYLVSLIRQQSARCRCVYAYSSAGWGESSTDLIFSGNAIIGEDGSVSESGERFLTREFSITKTVDIQKLKLERLKWNSFTDDSSIPGEFRIVSSDSDKPADSFVTNPDPFPFVPSDSRRLSERCEEIINIQAYGLMKRLHAIGCKKAVIGISGGLDSTLALLVTVRAFDRLGIPRSEIIGITMPGLATTSRTRNNAWNLMVALGVSPKEITIGKAVAQHFEDIGQDPQKFDAAYENSQARERTQILMDLANKENAIVIGTGDLSELALGWCTYNGDHMSMYGVNASVPKTLVRYLVEWFTQEFDENISSILRDIVATPISPELIPSGKDDISQKTEDLVGPYELHDFFLYNMLRNSFSPGKIYILACNAFKENYDKGVILKWLKTFYRRFFSQQFKRSCMPDGPKVGSVSLSPRGDWRMPSDAVAKLWLSELEEIKI